MESDVSQSAAFYKAWAWFERNKRQVAMGAVAAVFVGIIVGFVLWRREQKTVDAGEAVSAAVYEQISNQDRNAAPAEPFLRLANEYDNMSAGARALLVGAGNLFVQGKYDQSLTEFQKFTREHRESPFISQALLGVAASYDAQGKTNEAVTAYKNLVSQHSASPAAAQAKFALARIYEAQSQPKDAYNLLEEIARTDPFGSLGSEAGMRAEEIKQKHPEVVPPPPAPVSMGSNAAPAFSAFTTNAPVPGVAPTNAPGTGQSGQK